MNTRLLISAIAVIITNPLFSQTNLPAGASNQWFAQQKAIINKEQYHLLALAKTHSFIANNPANKLSFEITGPCYKVKNISVNPEAFKWLATFSVASLNGMTDVCKAGNYVVAHDAAASVVYSSALLNVNYNNSPAGLQQDFVVHKKQPGEKLLTIDVHVQTSLLAAVSNNQLVLRTGNNKTEVKLTYDQLKVYDAKGKVLSAEMKYNQQTNLLSITANDKGAVYPVTIDPLNSAPEWTTSADGVLPGLLNTLQLQVNSTYGFTVTGLGDINGDGYDDVAISAPTMADVITGSGTLTGVGAVFIYLGSPTGLSATPDKVLQPTTPVSGALFGFSVAAGDVTGDGKNDIIVGAPLDTYQTTASALLGTTTVNVQTGKVYVYRSEDIFSSPVPSPFVQIRLQGTANFSTGIAGLLQSNVNTKALFGLSVAVVKDLNGDGKADIVVGAPAWMGTSLLSAQTGAAFAFYSDNLSTTTPVQLNSPSASLLGITGLPAGGVSGLLFGFSIDGGGDYNKDGYPDIVIGAPAGVDLSSLGGIFTGQFLGGSAYVFYGSASGVQNTATVKLQANAAGLLSNAANLFGYKVKETTNATGQQTGNIIIGAPMAAVVSNIVGGLQIKAGELHIFKSKTAAANSTFTADQVISSPRASTVTSVLSGQTLNMAMSFGESIDNMMDVNCDNLGDIIVGEPLSTNVPVVGANVTGGAAYILTGKSDGTYEPAPYWTMTTQVSPLLGVNTTALLGWSVAGVGYTNGHSAGVRSLVGGPGNALDFGSGLLNLGNTMSTLNSFVFDNNGIGKTYDFSFSNCLASLPVKLMTFTANAINNSSVGLKWTAASEENLNYYELERSADGATFETVAMVFTKEVQSDDYNYPDKKPFRNMNYYRLKMVDKDEKFTYSDVVKVDLNSNAFADIMVAPNPVQTDINLRMTGLQNGNYSVELHNAAGQIFARRLVTVSGYTQIETIARENMPAGLYWINIFDNSTRMVKSIKIVLD